MGVKLSSVKYRADLDGLRGIAILSVALFHTFPQVVSGGFLGVDVFFVLSGFLISTLIQQNLEKGTFSFSDFYSRRIRRLVPPLVVVLAVSFILGWIIMLPDEFRQLGKYIAASSGFMANIFFWMDFGYFSEAAELNPLLHLWSLSLEEQFYLFWPLFLWLCFTKKLNTFYFSFVIAIISLLAYIYGLSNDPIGTYYSPLTRFWEFYAGSLIAWAMLKSRFTHPKFANSLNTISLLSFFALIYAVMTVKIGFLGVHHSAYIPVVTTAFMILCGPTTFLNRRILSHPILVWFGLLSYSAYLWHWVLITFTRLEMAGPVPVHLRLCLLALAFILAWLTYKFIERPMKILRTNQVRFSIICLLCVGILGLLIYLLDGMRPMEKKKKGQVLSLQKYDQRVISDPNYLEKQIQEKHKKIRTPQCHFEKNQMSFEKYLSGNKACVSLRPGMKNVLIIGDSVAADIYMTLSEQFKNIHFLQITGSGCAPIRPNDGFTDESCRKMWDYAIAFAEREPIASILISVNWTSDFEDFAPGIALLKKAGKPVTAFGPCLWFKESLPRLVSKRSEDDTLETLFAKYVDKGSFLLNEEVRKFVTENGFGFIDTLKPFCNFDVGKTCNFSSDDGELFFIDRFHLSPAGTRFLGNYLYEKKIFLLNHGASE